MDTAMDVSRYIINKCMRDGLPVSNLQLQKILYYLQKEFLKQGGRLFDDDFVAWQFGPAIEEVYYNYSIFGSMPIRRRFAIDLTQRVKAAIDPIIEAKRRMDPWELVRETHKKNGAWDMVYKDGAGNGETISKELIASRG